MSKTVTINQDKLLMLKETVASDSNIASHNDYCSELTEAAPEVDEYEIGDEGNNPPVGGNFYHVNESTSFDSSEIGAVNYSWDFDEEEYQEWLVDAEYENTQEALMEYINDNVEFELEYLDNETYHTCGSDYVDYNALEDMFGEKMQKEILTTCMNDGSGSFETVNLYSDDDVDINDRNSVNDMAMRLLRHGDYFKDCRGFILTNGVVVYTESEHNEICRIPNINNKFDFIRMGNIRVLPQSIDIGAAPTSEQRSVLRKAIASYANEELYLDIYQGKSSIGAKYIHPDWRYVMGEIDRFYSEGIKPQGNGYYESKNPKKQIVENKYDDLFNKANYDLQYFLKQGKEKYGFDGWYISSWMEKTHPEISVDPKDIKIYTALSDRLHKITKLWTDEDNKEESEKDLEQPKEIYDIISLAIEEFGLTSRLSQAGYILPDGKLLNFGSDGYREADHRQIAAVYKQNGIKIWNDEYRYNYVVDFMNHGAIRCDVNSGILDMTKEPTNEQFYTIKDFVRKAVDVDIDFTDDKGNTLHSVSYSDAKPQAVVADIRRYYEDGIKPMGNVQYEEKQSINKLTENFDFEVDSSEIDLSSFKKKHELVPNIWNPDGKLNSRIRLKLLDIADDFWEYVNLTWVKPSGIILTGSICNFNWSQYSDIDLHLIVDFDEIDEKIEFVKDYLDSKKNEWNNEHSGLQIMGYPVELYVQNLGEMPESNGIYDLEENDWIREPNPDNIKSIGLNKFSIKEKAAKIMTIIDDMYDALASTDDSHKIEQMGDDASYLWKKVKEMRKSSLEKNGESGSGNIVYKILRRTGYLDRLFKLSNVVYDKFNSITESKNKKKKYTVYIDGKKDDTFSDMNWKRKPKVGKGFYYGGAVFKIKKVTDDSIYAIEESKNTSAQLLNEWDKIDYFEKAKQYFGTTNDLNECGFILPNGEMLDLSSVKGRRGIPHRNVEAIGVGLETFIEHGAIRCDSRYKLINICKKPTKEQINRLAQIIKANDGSVSLDLGNGHVTFDYVDYKNANYKRIINDIINFFENKIKPSSLYESKNIIKEYLEKDNNLPLYKYFKWASTASSCEKARDLAYSCSYYIGKYIRKIYYRYSEFENLLNDGEFDYEDESLVEMFLNMLEENNLCDHFVSEMQNIVDYYELPSWCTMDFNRIVKNEWCIHFGSDSESIAKEGFTGGTPEIEHLAYTNAGAQKSSAGYDFAFLINDRSVDYNGYGDEAVIFRTSGVEIYHYGDNQNQVVFWGPNVKSFIPIHQDNGDWVVYGQNGQVLVRCGRPSEIALWATENLPQYRKQIMTGKNGYIPKMGRWNTETNKYERVPYPIYRNESVKKYITLLKENLVNEEVVADGNSEHNPYKKRWEAERKALKDFICNFGKVMTSKENGKTYKVYYDKTLSQLIGYNYCICLQWDAVNLKPKSVLYIRALDKFTDKMFQANFDARGKDNVQGTYDDNGF